MLFYKIKSLKNLLIVALVSVFLYLFWGINPSLSYFGGHDLIFSTVLDVYSTVKFDKTDNLYNRQFVAPDWVFTTGNGISSSPAIGSDGIIYVGSGDGKLYAVNPNGKKKWHFTTGDTIYSSPSIGADETIYIGSWDKKLYAINPDGKKKWEFVTSDGIESSPATGLDGTIYVGSWDKKLYAINPDGTKKWDFATGNSIRSSPSIGLDGTIYIGSRDNRLYAINPDGTKKWEFITGDNIYSSPAIGLDGTIYLGSLDGNLYAINPDGTKKWEFFSGGFIHSSPAIGLNGTIYVGSWNSRLYAVNPNGTKEWHFAVEDSISSSPAIGMDGSIYVGAYDGRIYAINPNGTERWNYATNNVISYSSPAIGYDGTVYVGSSDKNLYAIPTDCGGLANTPWSMFRSNIKHTGRYESSQYKEIIINLFTGWNMISCPGVPVISDIDTLVYNTPILPFVYTWEPNSNVYIQVNSIEFGKAYWFSTIEDTQLSIKYIPYQTLVQSAKAGWNMWGSISCSMPVNEITSEPSDSVIPFVYTWEPIQSSYIEVEDIKPGSGYWLASINDALVAMNCAKNLAPSSKLLLNSSLDRYNSLPNIYSANSIPKYTQLLANYPNPCNPDTWIPYHLSQDSDVELTIYDSTGREVRKITLYSQLSGIYEDKGYAIHWNGRNNSGDMVVSGVYYYNLRASGFSKTRKLVMLR